MLVAERRVHGERVSPSLPRSCEGDPLYPAALRREKVKLEAFPLRECLKSPDQPLLRRTSCA